MGRPYYFDIGRDVLACSAAIVGWGDLGAVWRYLDYDLDSNGPIVDMNFSGPPRA